MRYYYLFVFFSSVTAWGAIYQSDQRLDVLHSKSAIYNLAYAVGLVVPSAYLLPHQEANYFYHEEYNSRVYGEDQMLCREERFWLQPSFGMCTAFLVHERLILTAGHCFLAAGEVENQAHSFCENFSFWMAYHKQQNRDKLGEKIDARNILQCKKVIYAINDQKMNPEEAPIDFALLELEQSVEHIKPLSIADQEVQKNSQVYTLGHPHGLPLKFSGFASVIQSDYETVFTAALDTLGGNSGGPVFNHKNELVGLLVSGHQHDTYDTKNSCERINHCDQFGENCNYDSELFPLNLILKNEVWLPYFYQFLKENS